ncbi:MAG: hypothetical protein RLN85_19290, partial [Pseudomonadales bacterium]
EVNRGRFLCSVHGGFCDSVDGYSNVCPICKHNENVSLQVNPVDRSLHIINGLQNRSKRNAALVTAVSGGLASIGVLTKLVPGSTEIVSVSQPWFLASILILVVAVVLYGLSMKHVSITDRKGFKIDSIEGFERYLAGKTRNFECWHNCASTFVAVAVFCFATSIGWPILEDLYSQYKWSETTDGEN